MANPKKNPRRRKQALTFTSPSPVVAANLVASPSIGLPNMMQESGQITTPKAAFRQLSDTRRFTRFRATAK
jgi:hypothetical protein